jgi:tripartite-type tricarboxylate transporter receptor subunit TctC
MRLRNLCLVLAMLLTVTSSPVPVAAQGLPPGRVTLIVPVPAGGISDAIARVVGQGLSELWSRTVVVENRPGGNYGVGIRAASAAAPDGLTLLVVPDSTITANPHMFTNLNYNWERDLTPIAPLCGVNPVLTVHASVPATNLQELIALAKAKPNTLTYASFGVGTYAHLSMEDLKKRTGIEITHVPYRGAAPALTDLLGGQISMMISSLSTVVPQAKAGQLRILAAAGEKRSAAMPDLPTVAEAGVPGFSTIAWFGLFGPAKMAPELVSKINTDVYQVIGSQAVQKYFEQNSFERINVTPAQFISLIRHDSDHWGSLVRALNIKLE